MPDLLSLLDKSDRLKEVAPELSEYGRDLGDVQLLLRMMTELIPPRRRPLRGNDRKNLCPVAIGLTIA